MIVLEEWLCWGVILRVSSNLDDSMFLYCICGSTDFDVNILRTGIFLASKLCTKLVLACILAEAHLKACQQLSCQDTDVNFN